MDQELKFFSVQELADLHDAIEIPFFQRGKVWDLDLEQKLALSILQKRIIPHLYISLRADGSGIMDMIDGQQRHNSLTRFVRNEVPLSNGIMNELGLTGRYFGDLPPDRAKAFLDHKIGYVLITNATEDELTDFYLRLQSVKVLNATEKYKASGSPLAQFCREMARHPFFKTRVALPDYREEHLKLILKIAAIEVGGPATNYNGTRLIQRMESDTEGSLDPEIAQRLRDTAEFLLAFPSEPRALALLHKSMVQSAFTLAARIVETGKSAGLEEEFADLIMKFHDENTRMRGKQGAGEHREFNLSLKSGYVEAIKIRDQVLRNWMAARYPNLAAVLDITVNPLQDQTSPNASAFCGLLRQATMSIGIPSSSAFETSLHLDRRYSQIYPEPSERQAAIGRFVSYYNGKEEPLDENGHLTRDAAVLVHTNRVSSTRLVAAVPELREFWWTDAVRDKLADLSQSMRRAYVFTFSHAEEILGSRICPPDEKVEVLGFLNDAEALTRPSAKQRMQIMMVRTAVRNANLRQSGAPTTSAG